MISESERYSVSTASDGTANFRGGKTYQGDTGCKPPGIHEIEEQRIEYVPSNVILEIGVAAGGTSQPVADVARGGAGSGQLARLGV